MAPACTNLLFRQFCSMSTLGRTAPFHWFSPALLPSSPVLVKRSTDRYVVCSGSFPWRSVNCTSVGSWWLIGARASSLAALPLSVLLLTLHNSLVAPCVVYSADPGPDFKKHATLVRHQRRNKQTLCFSLAL